MFDNTEKLLAKLKHDLYITVPDDLWHELYQNLQNTVINYGTTRNTALLTERTYNSIQIVTINHYLVVKIPQILDHLSEVDFTNRFNQLSSKQQTEIKSIIQSTITKSARRRQNEQQSTAHH